MAWPPPGAGDSYRPNYNDPGSPPHLSADAKAAMYHFQGNSNAQAGNATPNRPPRDFSYRSYRPKVSERPLLRSRRESTEKTIFREEHLENKFRAVDDLTDTDETDMKESTDEGESRPSKRHRVDVNGTHSASTSKWSNPDPYTALPPVNEGGKKKDVIKLIRKARNQTDSSTVTKNPAADGDDFISFDFEDENDSFSAAPAGAPSGPRTDRVNSEHVSLGKRKRAGQEKFGREIRRRGKTYYSNGQVLPDWEASEDCDPCPWFTVNQMSSAISPGIALHKEIIDFYEWIRPRDFEAAVRADVVSRLEKAFKRLEPRGELKAFGSYAAGLYLPTADMDLVFMTNASRPMSYGLQPPLSHNALYRFRDFIQSQELAVETSIQVIKSAKVPIIKFVEKLSGLKVDLCFNNPSGLAAIDNFCAWRSQHPAMPIIVSIIKQFLMIRGINDVALGGLGGFSTICLVTSLIQHLPNTGQPSNLGGILLEFFNLYGNLFNRQELTIRLEPPSYLEKRMYAPFAHTRERPDRLSIIDPNRPDNNISGGTSEVDMIFRCFSDAHETLQDRLSAHDPTTSILETIIGGDFSAYSVQRGILQHLYDGTANYAPAVTVPPPPPIGSIRAPPPPPATSSLKSYGETAALQNATPSIKKARRKRGGTKTN